MCVCIVSYVSLCIVFFCIYMYAIDGLHLSVLNKETTYLLTYLLTYLTGKNFYVTAEELENLGLADCGLEILRERIPLLPPRNSCILKIFLILRLRFIWFGYITAHEHGLLLERQDVLSINQSRIFKVA